MGERELGYAEEQGSWDTSQPLHIFIIKQCFGVTIIHLTLFLKAMKSIVFCMVFTTRHDQVLYIAPGGGACVLQQFQRQRTFQADGKPT